MKSRTNKMKKFEKGCAIDVRTSIESKTLSEKVGNHNHYFKDVRHIRSNRCLPCYRPIPSR